MHCNPDEAVRVFARISPDLWLGRRRIAYWAWELERTPKHWVAASSLFHEVWVPSTFVADALRSSGINSPIRVMPHPVSIGALAVKPDRARWGFAEGQLAVVVMGDLGSSAARKNIIGAIDIYREAFPAGSASKLLVKIVRSDASFLAATRAHIGDRPDIRIVTETAPPKDVMSLIASADVLLSPHRSEGFGLTLAEAMLLGTPALATGWSGNIDFMGELGDLLIDYRFVTVKDPVGIYREKGLRWAEPGFDDAIAKLRRLAASEEMRIALTARGAAIVRSFEQSWSRDSLLQSALGSVLA